MSPHRFLPRASWVPAPLPVTWAVKMAALGREAGADLRDGSVVPVGAGEVPKVGGNRVVRAFISAASSVGGLF